MSSSAITPPRTIRSGRSSRRHVLNMRLLLITVVSIAVIAAVMLLWYRYRRGQMATVLLDRAEQLEGERNWSEATSYYQRSLLLNPDDTETLLRLVGAYAKQEQTPGRMDRLTRLLYQALGRVPDRDDLRRILAENLLQMGDYAAAEGEAVTLAKSPNETPIANKIIALSLAVRRWGRRGRDQRSHACVDSSIEGSAGGCGVGHAGGNHVA